MFVLFVDIYLVIMFNKIMKRGQKKPSKPEIIEPPMPAPAAANVNVVNPQPSANVTYIPPNPGVVEVLPNLKDVPLADRHVLFIRKIQICCFEFDFSDIMKSAREKEIKRQTLAELIDFVQSGSNKMNEIMQEELIKMLEANICRCLPPRTHENTGTEHGEPDEDEMFMDPSWPHLQLVYEIFLAYLGSKEMDTKVAKRCIDHTFVLRLLDLFDSEDPRERDYLKTVVHRIYGKFMVHRPYIRNLIYNIFYRFIFETERHCGISELLDVLGCIINGFALPMKEEHKFFLVRALIPLHKPKSIIAYHSQLAYCISQYVEKDYRLADIVIRGLLKYWPLTNCAKEVLFIGELEEVLEGTQPVEFQRCIVPLFRQLGRSINSPHFQVAERALFLWNNEYIVELVAQNRHVILPIIFESVEKNLQGHWNQAILGLTSNVRKMFMEMDAELFDECEKKFEEKMARAKEVEEQRVSMWKKIEEVAGLAGGEEKVAHARKKSLLGLW